MSRIWRLGPERAAEWRAIRLAALAEAPDAFGSTLAEWQNRPLADFAARLSATHSFAAGAAPGAPQAVAGWSPGDGNPDAWLIGVWARPEVRRQGLTRKLVLYVMNDAAQAGYSVMQLGVGAHNHGAQALYHSLGFRPVPHSAAPNPRGVIEITMRRKL
ncbi:GNAT family N-acetyltransferase [Paracoccus pacificus]|uniref:GNAT family N-acetyltransferase n=1 Tax=Paracoccus pacificus TaxID=1463598 RepID=A0ABW4RB42_9RHOB